MKNLIIAICLIAVSSLTWAASIETLEIKCVTPANFAGNSANVSGILELKKRTDLPAYAREATGNLDIRIGGSSANPIYDNDHVALVGQYEKVGGIEYVVLESRPTKNMIVSIFFTDQIESYVDYEGAQYPMSCTKVR